LAGHSHSFAVREEGFGLGAAAVLVAQGDSASSNYTSGTTGGDNPHNHGTTYRPLAQVGIIATKD